MSSHVAEPRIPSFNSFLPTENPLKPFSTMKAEMPLVPFDLSVIAITMKTSALEALVMNILVPLRIHLSPASTAVVCCIAASVPALGSVRPNAPIHSPEASLGRYFIFCSSVPCSKIGATHNDVCADKTTPVVAQALESSSTAIIYICTLPPAPPYCFGTGIPIKPNFAILLTVSIGKRSCSSISAAKGLTSFSANDLIICKNNSSVFE